MDDFLLRALAAGLVIAAAAGPLGCFVVWRHMAFFGNTLAHAALLGVALGFLLGIDPMVGLAAVGAAVAILLVAAEGRWAIASDTLLSILAHGALAAGLVVLAFVEGVRIDLMAYLFGDILAVTGTDLAIMAAAVAGTLAALAAIWRPLLRLTIHEEIAAVEGVPVVAIRIIFMVLLAVIVAVALKVVGILLVASFLVIPAAAARRFAATPEAMAVIAAALGCVSVALGLAGSVRWDLPAGAAMVVAAALLFVLSLAAPALGAFRRR
jgi:zinc transport system permease protein